MTQMDADERHEDLTGMDRIDRIRILSHHEGHEVNEAKPGCAGLQTGFIDFAVPATNASPLDHARRAAGGELGETMFCLQGKPGQFRVPPRDPPPELLIDG